MFNRITRDFYVTKSGKLVFIDKGQEYSLVNVVIELRNKINVLEKQVKVLEEQIEILNHAPPANGGPEYQKTS